MFRRVIEASRSRVPASLGCVIDAALASDAVALSGDRTGVAIVIVTHGSVAKCPALSKVDSDRWAATIGAVALAPTRAASVLGDPRWSRPRDYLVRSPVALAADLGSRHVIVAAGADPITAWLAVDESEPQNVDALHVELSTFLERWQTLPLGSKLATKRQGTQIVVTANGIDARDLSVLVADVLTLFDTEPAPRPSMVFGCPRFDNLVTHCHASQGGTQGSAVVTVTSLSRALREIISTPFETVISNGDVVGVRLTADSRLMLRRGDLIVAVDSRRVTSAIELETITSAARGHVTLSVRRGGAEAVIELRE
jgi:hypothetical protein